MIKQIILWIQRGISQESAIGSGQENPKWGEIKIEEEVSDYGKRILEE